MDLGAFRAPKHPMFHNLLYTSTHENPPYQAFPSFITYHFHLDQDTRTLPNKSAQ